MRLNSMSLALSVERRARGILHKWFGRILNSSVLALARTAKAKLSLFVTTIQREIMLDSLQQKYLQLEGSNF